MATEGPIDGREKELKDFDFIEDDTEGTGESNTRSKSSDEVEGIPRLLTKNKLVLKAQVGKGLRNAKGGAEGGGVGPETREYE